MKKSLFVLLAATLLLASCGGDGTSSDITTTAPAETGTETPAVTEDTRLRADLPEANFDGYQFNVAHWMMSGWESRACKDIYAEAESGETINDAVYTRNLAVCDKYNFTIALENFEFSEIQGMIQNMVSAGDDNYDLAYVRLYEQKNMIAGGYLTDFYKIPNLDLTKPWWDQGCLDTLTVSGKLYLAASAINISDKNATAAILFNKKIAGNHDLPDLYALVHEGKWTIDKMRELYTDVSTDVNGDGKMGDGDLWGFLGGNDVQPCFFIGGGGSFVSRDENGMLYDSFNTEHNMNVAEAIQELMCDKTSFYNHHTGTGDQKLTDDNEYRNLFASEKGLFFWSRLDEVTTLRSMETDFGILPTPKYDEAQEDYISFVSQHITALMSVPASASDLNRTGIILEALAAESYYTVLPAYYDVALKTKGSRDDESAQMLDIIFGNRKYDLGEYFDFGGFVQIFNTACTNETLGIASRYEKAAKKIESAINKWVEQIEGLE